MVVLDILLIMLTTVMLVQDTRAGDNPLLLLWNALPLAMIAVGQYLWWQSTFRIPIPPTADAESSVPYGGLPE